MKTWAECHAAGMTLNQAVKSTGQRRNTGTSWATRNGVSWPDSAPHADRQSVRTGYIPGPSKAQHSTAPVSIPRAPWGDIEIDARSDTAPRNDGLLARAGRAYRRELGINPGAITAIIRDMHREVAQ